MLLNFLKTELDEVDLAVALQVLREFMDCEGVEEMMNTPGMGPVLLRIFEAILANRVEGRPLPDEVKALMWAEDIGRKPEVALF